MKYQEQFFEHLQGEANRKRQNASFSGEMGDGGALRIENEMEIYKAGIAGSIPYIWENSYKAFSQTKDPEYEKYLELKEKFK